MLTKCFELGRKNQIQNTSLKIKMDKTDISGIIMLEMIIFFSKVIHYSTPMYMLNRIRYLFESLLLQSPRNEIHLCAYK